MVHYCCRYLFLLPSSIACLCLEYSPYCLSIVAVVWLHFTDRHVLMLFRGSLCVGTVFQDAASVPLSGLLRCVCFSRSCLLCTSMSFMFLFRLLLYIYYYASLYSLTSVYNYLDVNFNTDNHVRHRLH